MVDYGTDFRVDFDTEDIMFSVNNDFELISGLDNLAQAIKTRLLTKIGDLYTHPEFGSRLWELIGMSIDESALNTAGSYVYQAISQEPRVQEINSITVQFQTIDENPTLVIFLEVTPIDTDVPLNLVVNFEV